MSSRTKIAIIGALVVILAVLFYFITPEKKKQKKKEKPKKEFLHKELYKQKLNKDGLYILHKLMETYPQVVSLESISDPLDSSLVANEGELPSIYFLIDNDISISNKEVRSIMSFVENGNHAFVSLNTFNNSLGYEFSRGNLTRKISSESALLNHTHDTLETDDNYVLQKFTDFQPEYFDWNYIDINKLRKVTNDVVTLSTETIYEKPVFIRIPYVDGYFYIHSIPKVFYNESMFSLEGMEHVQRALSNLPRGHYKWHSHLNQWDISKDVRPRPDDNIARESPIQYILADSNLRNAYLLLLATIIIYVLFKLKRKRNIIPTVEPNNNNSLEFVETVSKLYLRQNKHSKFVKHYELSFIHFIKDKYYITSPVIDESYVEAVAIKSEIEKEKLTGIFNEFNKAKKTYDYSSDDLIELHKKVEYFYKNCK